jgi:hypothetical protein
MMASSELNAKQFDLLQTMENTVTGMVATKESKPVLYIPFRFMEVYNSPEMIDLLKSILDYTTDLFKLEYKLEVLSAEARTKNLPDPKPLPSELRRLEEKAQEMARKYGWIIISFKKSKNKQEDQNLYETILYFMHKTLSAAFDSNDVHKLEEELSRLFRSTAFNITLRKQAEADSTNSQPSNQKSLLRSCLNPRLRLSCRSRSKLRSRRASSTALRTSVDTPTTLSEVKAS